MGKIIPNNMAMHKICASSDRAVVGYVAPIILCDDIQSFLFTEKEQDLRKIMKILQGSDTRLKYGFDLRDVTIIPLDDAVTESS